MKTIKLLLICLIAQVSILSAQPQQGEEFRCNMFTEGLQNCAGIASLGSDRFVVCWDTQDENGNGIHAQIYKTTGEKIGDEFSICNDPVMPLKRIAAVSQDRFVVCWSTFDSYPNHISAKIFDSDGNMVGKTINIPALENEELGYPDVTSYSDGGFVLAWIWCDYSINDHRVYAQKFNSEGEAAGTPIFVYQGQCQLQYTRCAVFEDGRFVVCWWSWDQENIVAQILSPDGDKLEKLIVNETGFVSQNFIGLSALPNNRFVVTWDNTNAGIMGRIISMSEPGTTEFQINSPAQTLTASSSRVSQIADSGFVVTWTYHKGVDRKDDIYAQLFDKNGIKRGCEFLVNTTTSGMQIFSDVVSVPDDQYVICWEFDTDIYGKRFPIQPLHHQLIPFRLLQPEYDTTLHTIYPHLIWERANAASLIYPCEIEYHVYYDTTPDFTDPDITTAFGDTSITLPELSKGQTYFSKVLAKNVMNETLWSSNMTAFFISPSATDITVSPDHPQDFTLYQNYPNPFNSQTVINFSLSQKAAVTLDIYNTLGQKIADLIDEEKPSGKYSVVWSAKSIPDGVYLYRLTAGYVSEVKKMIVLK